MAYFIVKIIRRFAGKTNNLYDLFRCIRLFVNFLDVQNSILSNIYMHYALVWWFKKCVEPKLKGYGGLVVYADDFVACFQYKEEAEKFYKHLKGRMEHFGMTLEESKIRLIEFGRYAENSG